MYQSKIDSFGTAISVGQEMLQGDAHQSPPIQILHVLLLCVLISCQCNLSKNYPPPPLELGSTRKYLLYHQL